MRFRLPNKSLVLFFVLYLTTYATMAFCQSSGMNRVVLKQSNEKGKTVLLKQDMFNISGNTIYVIQSNFELAEDITIPSDCVLEFEGGCLKNGRINTNGCYIDAGLYQVFDNIQFNTFGNYDGLLEVVDNVYVKVMKSNSFVNKKTNSIVKANSIINRRYTYIITGKTTDTKTEGEM